MNAIFTFVARSVQILIAATLVLAGFVVALGLLAIVVVVGGAVLATALVTGRRPQLRMGKRFDPRAAWRRAWPAGRAGEARSGPTRRNPEVIDVEAREVGEPPRAP